MRLRPRFFAGLAVAVTGLAVAAVAVPRVGPDGLAAAAVTATSASAVTWVVPYTPYPSPGPELYVDNSVNAHCSDSGAGTDAQPLCTIAAAASVAQPGQTVVVEPGTYAGATISAQGTPQAPITFDAIEGATVNGVAGGPALAISGARDVALDGFSVVAGPSQQAVYVTGGSSGITINGGYAGGGNNQVPAIEVGGTSSDVTVSRMAIDLRLPVQVDPGASGVVIAGNTIQAAVAHTFGVLVTDAPGTEVTGNTIQGTCAGGISVAGASAGVTVENNIVQSLALTYSVGGCPAGTAITVSAGSEASSVIDYNLIDPSGGGSLYDWGGTGYTSLGDFQAASGLGAHDIAASPGITGQASRPGLGSGAYVFWFALQAGSPAIDSADSTAPGALPTDQLGSPRTDDPSVPNAGPGYYDRGASELEGPTVTASGHGTAASSGSLTATWTLGLTPTWTTNGPMFVVQVNFGDGTPQEVGRASNVRHTFSTAGLYDMSYEYSTGCCVAGDSGGQVVVGAEYTPVTPRRILDTRTGAGIGKAAPIGPKGTVTLPIPSINGVPADDISAVVMNVTVTQPAQSGNLIVFPGVGSGPTVSNLNFSARETVPNLVTVQVADGEVSFHNASGGATQVFADLEGFYGPGGYGYQPETPTRVLDTRTGTGGKGPVAAGEVLRLSLAGKVPAAAAAAVMNVTVTTTRKSGYLSVYPDGAHPPNASNLNFSAGETVPNLAIVMGGRNGQVSYYNNSPGQLQLIVDEYGYYINAG